MFFQTNQRSITQMNLNTLRRVRQQIWRCFSQSRDALFELIDALSSEPAARSLPELSLSAAFRRKWPSQCL
jgi:hypothetical protein